MQCFKLSVIIINKPNKVPKINIKDVSLYIITVNNPNKILKINMKDINLHTNALKDKNLRRTILLQK